MSEEKTPEPSEPWIFLGDYLAIYDKSRHLIEAEVTSLSAESSVVVGRSLMDLPGVSWGPPRYLGLFEEYDSPDKDIIEAALAEPSSRQRLMEDRAWTLSLRSADGALAAEMSACSNELLSIDTDTSVRSDKQWQTLGIKLLNRNCRDHDEALELLERTSSALFFEIDLRYSMQLGLAQRRLPGLRARSAGVRAPDEDAWKAPQMPCVHYQHDAVSLYLHGRSSHGLPLSQFLAYYQAIEYHFPRFVGRDLLKRMRNKLRDPGFNPENHSHLQQVVALDWERPREAAK